MVQLASQQAQFVQADIVYGSQPPNGEQAYNYISNPPEGEKRNNIEPEIVSLPVTDIRTHGPTTLQRNGFQLETFDAPGAVQWDDEEQVHRSVMSARPVVHNIICSSCPQSCLQICMLPQAHELPQPAWVIKPVFDPFVVRADQNHILQGCGEAAGESDRWNQGPHL